MAEDTSGFHLFAVDPPYAAQTIRKKLSARIQELKELIARGGAKDFADYCGRVEHIKGLEEAMTLCDDMERQNQNDRRALRNAG